MTVKPIPDNYRRITPCLIVHNGTKALDFYAEVFGATERMRYPGPDNTVSHAEIQIGDSVVMVEDESPERGTKAPPAGGLDGSPSFLFIYVDDVDATVDKAVKLGARLVRAHRTSSTATGTATSSTHSDTAGPWPPTSRTSSPTS
jgi:PhnB protein